MRFEEKKFHPGPVESAKSVILTPALFLCR